MDVVLLLFLIFSIGAEAQISAESRDEHSVNDNFENELEQGYKKLKGVPNADYTKQLLEQLHKMEPEIKQELTLSPERKAELREQMKNYVEIKNDYGQLMGQTIEEINLDNKIGRALFQGDILLTKEQADEIIEDVKENKANRRKRQAYRDSRYPNTLWSNGVYYSFHWNATQGARRVFRKAAQIWQSETCINFFEGSRASDGIVVFQGPGCYSNIGRIGGTQVISLGRRCEHV
uniref:Astacin domain-containing protein n=1 Tax=Angiostrongylus cantonensis TaxID=6313 RepID=A0A0K0DMG9_ANGCA